jgi:hypothetical protein
MSAIQIQEHLQQLEAERALARIEGLETHSLYMTELEGEISAARDAYVGAAVIAIATLRAELFGPQFG